MIDVQEGIAYKGLVSEGKAHKEIVRFPKTKGGQYVRYVYQCSSLQ